MEARPNFKEMTNKKKLEYIWDYYKFFIIGSIFIIYVLSSTIYNHLTEKECLLKIIMVNGSLPYDGAIFADDFLLGQGFNPETQEIVVSSLGISFTEKTYQQDYYTMQSLIARLTSGDIDIMSAPSDIFKDFAYEGYFTDLRIIFSEEELSSLKNYLVYTTNPDTNESYPCGFDLTDNTWIKKYGYYQDNCQFGILYNVSHLETAKNFLLYILNY